MISTPISPKEAKEYFDKNFPSFVVEAINDLVRAKYNPRKSEFTVSLKEVKEKIANAISNYNDNYGANAVFQDYYLDFEDIYEKHGWMVKYDKPSYGEDFESFYKFTVKK